MCAGIQTQTLTLIELLLRQALNGGLLVGGAESWVVIDSALFLLKALQALFRVADRVLRHDGHKVDTVQPEADDVWDGETGYVHEAAERLFEGRFSGCQAYLCGPPPMIEAGVIALMKGRLFERDIFMERFLTAGDAEATARSPLFRKI